MIEIAILSVSVALLLVLLCLLSLAVRVHKSLTLMHSQSFLFLTRLSHIIDKVQESITPGSDGQSPLGQSVESMVTLYAELTADLLFNKFRMSAIGERGGSRFPEKSTGKGGFAGLRDLFLSSIMEHIPGLDKLAEISNVTGNTGESGDGRGTDLNRFNKFGGR